MIKDDIESEISNIIETYLIKWRDEIIGAN